MERRRRVREVARLEVVDRELDREVRVRGERAAVGRVLELGRGHLALRGDDAHRRLVARALLDLLPVRLLLVREEQAEVDEVVRRRQRRLLPCRRRLLARLREREDVARVDRQRGLGRLCVCARTRVGRGTSTGVALVAGRIASSSCRGGCTCQHAHPVLT